MYVQVPRGSIVTASKAFAPQKSPNLCLKRRRSNPDQPTLKDYLRKQVVRRLVWGPGAGGKAAGRLCFSHNETGVASLP
jgi:hypothetical protein